MYAKPEDLARWVWPASLPLPKTATLIDGTKPGEAIQFTRVDERHIKPVRWTNQVQGIEIQLELPLIASSTRGGAQRWFSLPGSAWAVYPASWVSTPFPFRATLALKEQRPGERLMHALGQDSELRASFTGKQLQAWDILAGPIKEATFRDPIGRVDEIFAAGAFTFDIRWLAAELAGLRSAVDTYFGSPHATRYTFMVQQDESYELNHDLGIHAMLGGIDLSIQSDIGWTSRERLALAHYFVQKKLQGLFDYAQAPDAQWAQGVLEIGLARYVARQIAFEYGTVSAAEVADDLNALQTRRIVAISGQNKSKWSAIQAGTALALLLDRELRSKLRGSSSLRAWLMDLRAQRKDQAKALHLEEVAKTLKTRVDRYTLEEWQATLHRKAVPELQDGAFAPCLLRKPGDKLVLDYGFESAKIGEPLGALSPFGKDKLGLEPSDILTEIKQLGTPDAPTLKLVLMRGQEKIELSFRPQVQRISGKWWSRSPQVPDHHCGF